MTAVRLNDVSVSFGDKHVLKGLDLEIKRGEFAGILGETGCGKTTLLLLLNGIIPKSVKAGVAGEVVVDNKNVAEKSVADMSKSVAFVFQNPDDQIFSSTLAEEVEFALRLQKLGEATVRTRTKKALECVGLYGLREEDPTTLSQGQKQKLAIASALALETPVLALDEPVSSLDYKSAKDVYGVLQSLNKKGKTIVVVEHDTAFLEKTASKIVVLHEGRVKKTGGPEVLRTSLLEKLGLKRLD